MLNTRTILGARLNLRQRLTLFAAFASLLIAIPVAGFAQETTGIVRGAVYTPSGDPVAGATVTVTDTRTSASRSTTTGADGMFRVGGLAIGGPFEIRVASADYKSAQITDVYTSLSEAATFSIMLESGEVEEIVVTASRDVAVANLAIGPSANFTIDQLQAAPAINRNITDVIRADPRIYVDESRRTRASTA
jgi:hypothetical protein